MATLTGARVRVIMRTKCAEKMAKKYRTASAVIVPKMVRTSAPGMNGVFNLTAENMINESARVSGVHQQLGGSALPVHVPNIH